MKGENGRKVKVRSAIAFLALLLCISVPASSWAALDMYVRFEGIPGDVTLSPQLGSGWIKIHTWSWGTNLSALPGATSTGAASSRATTPAVAITMPFHPISPVLFQYATTGRVIRSATLIGVAAGSKGELMTRITLENVFVSAYKSTAATTAPVPIMDEFSLVAQRLKYEYPGKGVTTGFDFQANRGL